MWQRIRQIFNLFQSHERGADPAAQETSDLDTSTRLDQLQVSPDDGEDFDAEACSRLLRTIAERGGTTVDSAMGVAVTLEDFFEGNRTKHSIAANVVPAAPFDTAQAWFAHLKRVRDHEGVRDVLVSIYMIEPYEGDRIGSWPYADTVWVYASLDQGAVAELLAPLEPDEVRNAAVPEVDWDLKPPFPAAGGFTPFWIWWD